MGLRIEIRKHQHKEADGNNVVVDCAGGVATYIAGTEDQTWYDITEDCDGLDSLQLSEQTIDGTNKAREKGATTQITIGFSSYALVVDYLTATECSFLNYFDVRITDIDLNFVYRLYELKPDNIEFCDDNGCQIQVPLREIDEYKSITDKISIHDDWQGWFGGGQKDFPCMQVFKHLNAMEKAFTLGALATISIMEYLSFGLINVDDMRNKAYGFGYFLPTPYIRDILKNAMAKIGYTLESPFDVGNFAENDVYVYSNGYYHINYNGDTSPSLKFIFENRQILTFTTFLDELCKLYNCVWQIVGSKLIITPIKDIDTDTPVFEIFKEDAYSDCKTFSFEKGKAGGRYEYLKDGTDSGSSETINEYNDMVDFDGVANNAILSGTFNKDFKFASTSFWGDSFGEDIGESISDFAKITLVMIILTLTSVSVSLLAGTVTATGAGIIIGVIAALTVAGFAWINGLQSDNEFGTGSQYKYSIRVIGTGSIFTPRIIRTDPSSPMNYKKPVTQATSTIVINPKYNLNNVAWKDQWNGHGSFLEVYNYPMFFDANYFGNMYDTLHEQTDNALFLQQSNEKRTIIVPLCHEYLIQTGIASDNSIVGKIITYNAVNYKVLKYEINYSDLSIKFEVKKVKNV
jgi:hypothetical protein